MSPRLGILTGISYVSGVDYYRGIHERVLAETPVGHLMAPNPVMTLVSVDCDEYAHLLELRAFDAVANYLLQGVDRLVATDCDTLAIASNTGHICIPLVEARHPHLDVVHIADCVARVLRRLEVSHVGLLGTQPTMEEPYLRDRLARHGISTLVPAEETTRREIYRIIYEELSFDERRPSSRVTVVDAIGELSARGAGACILGCTELELLVHQHDVPAVPLIPSAQTHIEVIADVLLERVTPDELRPH